MTPLPLLDFAVRIVSCLDTQRGDCASGIPAQRPPLITKPRKEQISRSHSKRRCLTDCRARQRASLHACTHHASSSRARGRLGRALADVGILGDSQGPGDANGTGDEVRSKGGGRRGRWRRHVGDRVDSPPCRFVSAARSCVAATARHS